MVIKKWPLLIDRREWPGLRVLPASLRPLRCAPMIYESILGTIGRTPDRAHPAPGAARRRRCTSSASSSIPARSVKDRLAIAIIEDAEARGTLKPGQTVVEATSGNTGIALAMVCAAKGYPFVAVMVETLLGRAPQDHAHVRRRGDPDAGRRARHRAWCARPRSWPASTAGSSRASSRIPANPAYHRNTTGPEILSDFAGRRLDYFVTGWGTGGTLTGVGEMIRLARPEVQIIAAEPEAAALLSGKPFSAAQDPGLDAGLRARGAQPRGAATASSPSAMPRRSRPRASWRAKEGIFCGISSGATFAAALKVAREAGRRAPWCWRCCPTPASAISPRRCSRASPMARIRNPECASRTARQRATSARDAASIGERA